MQVKESHIIAAGMIVVVLGAGAAQHRAIEEDEDKDRSNSVTACVRNTERSALNSVGWNDIAQSRKERGDTKRAVRKAKAIEQALMETAVPPKGLKRGDPRLFEVVTITYPSGKQKLQLTEGARKLIEGGCKVAFPPR
jgi:hypothetical protein